MGGKNIPLPSIAAHSTRASAYGGEGVWVLVGRDGTAEKISNPSNRVTYCGVLLPRLPAGAVVKIRNEFDATEWGWRAEWAVKTSSGKEVVLHETADTPIEMLVAQVLLVA